MMSMAITLTPLAIKYIDMLVMAAIHKGFQDADSMTDEELDTAIAELEVKAKVHSDWVKERIARARGGG